MLTKSTFVNTACDRNWDKKTKQQHAIDLHNKKVLFLRKVKEAIDAESPLSLLTNNPKHYLTIVGIDGENLKVVDSLKSRRGKIQTVKLSELFDEQRAQIVEIVWMGKIRPVEDLKKEYKKLEYDEEKGFSNKDPLMEEITNVAQTKGVMVTKYNEDMEVFVDGVRECVYLPKQYKAGGE